MKADTKVAGWLGDKVAVRDHYLAGDAGIKAGDAVTVVDFERIHYGRLNGLGYAPGLGYNTSYVLVETADRRMAVVSSSSLKPLDGAPDRVVAKADLKVAELPETDLWELDKVRFKDGKLGRVVGIEFANVGKKRTDGSPMPVYRVDFDADSSYWYYGDDDLELVARGNVWRIGHGEPPAFVDVEEEARFRVAVGEYAFVKNEAAGTWGWTEVEALDALERGDADGLTGGRSMIRWSSVNAITFDDRELGERVRAEMLKREGREAPAAGPSRP
jgi:hypothetical protein